jgi:uncharacterized protein (TIGR00730 family)
LADDITTAANRAEREEAIQSFAAKHLPGENTDLYQEMMKTICRLARDEVDRGDVKLLHKALAELRYAFKVFAPYSHVCKISIFGSARTAEDHPDYRAAVEFARLMADRGWMVITGAGDGIMKAGHEGPGREASFGVAIRLPFEQQTNTIIADDEKLVNFRYFFTRKLMFMKEASAVALFPGGFGTQDEGFEALTLIQTGKAPLQPIVMVEQPGGTYWLQWRAYVKAELLSSGMISPEDLSFFYITDDMAKAAEHICTFYRGYHSMRYVNEDLVLRLQQPVEPAVIERLNDEFGDILSAGRIESTEPLPSEADEYPDKARLKLRFNRKSNGRLRQMVDLINNSLPGETRCG